MRGAHCCAARRGRCQPVRVCKENFCVPRWKFEREESSLVCVEECASERAKENAALSMKGRDFIDFNSSSQIHARIYVEQGLRLFIIECAAVEPTLNLTLLPAAFANSNVWKWAAWRAVVSPLAQFLQHIHKSVVNWWKRVRIWYSCSSSYQIWKCNGWYDYRCMLKLWNCFYKTLSSVNKYVEAHSANHKMLWIRANI